MKAVADPTRRRILERLGAGGLPVSEIAARFPMSRPAISKHLRILRESSLVVERRRGRQRVYERQVERLELLADWLARLEQAPEPVADGVEETSRPARASMPRRSSRPEAPTGESPLGEDQDERQWRSW